jgi:hypothetical protein
MISLFSSDRRKKNPVLSARAAVQLLTWVGLTLAAQTVGAAGSDPIFEKAPEPVRVEDAAKQGSPSPLVLDDGSWEGSVGFLGRQFLWFNQFSLGGLPYELLEVSVLFPSGSGVFVGDAIQIGVWHDPDGDPTNGADLLTSFDTTIQAVDGTTFSVYPVAPPIVTPSGGDLLVGVINRYVVGGVPASTNPAAIDTTDPQGRSWYATWTGDPPDPPALPSDETTALIDPFVAGNWMIRADGLVELQGIPAQTPLGSMLLISMLAAAAAWLLRSRT